MRARTLHRAQLRSASRCRVCSLLDAAKAETERIAADRIEKETARLEQIASQVALLTEVCPAPPRPEDPGLPAAGRCVEQLLQVGAVGPSEAAQDTAAAVEELRAQAEQDLRRYAAEAQQALLELEQGLGADLDRAEKAAETALARARCQLQLQREREAAALLARQADAEEELRRVEARVKREKAESAAAATAEVRERDAQLAALHGALVEDLDAVRRGRDEAMAGRAAEEELEAARTEVCRTRFLGDSLRGGIGWILPTSNLPPPPTIKRSCSSSPVRVGS